MKVLVTGAGGQLGRDLVAHCASLGDDVVAASRAQLDVGTRDQVWAAITAHRPQLVVNTAAWTAVDACEGDLDRAVHVNGLALRWMREACQHVGAHLVQISTDYVFDGALDRPYHEWDLPCPASAYGLSKLAGETEAGPDSTIIRTSWVAGQHGNNMVATVLRLAAEGTPLSFVDDQRGCPTFTADLAPMVRHLGVERAHGVHHVTNQGAVSWYEFVQQILVSAGHDPAMVSPISTADLDPPRPAPRPPNSVLDNMVLRLAGTPLLRHFEAPLHELVRALTD